MFEEIMMEMTGDTLGRARPGEEEDESDSTDRESIMDVIKRVLSNADDEDCLDIHVSVHDGKGHVSVTQDYCDLLINESDEEEEESEEEDEDSEEAED